MIKRIDIAAYIRTVEADQNTGLSSGMRVHSSPLSPPEDLRGLTPFTAAAMAFSVWDILLSLSDEPHEFTVYDCDASTLAESILLECIIIAVETVLLMRVLALYSRSRLVLLGLLAGLFGSACATFCGMWYTMSGFIYDAECYASSSPDIMLLVWLSPVAFESALFIMTLVKFRESRRFGLGKRPILDTIMRDGTWGFVVALVVMSLNAVVYTLHAEALSGVFYFWALSTLSFTGSHMLLNLRRIAYEPQTPWDATSAVEDTICFEHIDLSIPSIETDDDELTD
ncbi:hypothetical protein GY45DRAFT_1357718 [Cubamyces sp. BRFM 1775]|nr:hypothetical protein GY45DRAFT_1357718 [Cubamyces sp. BRFM 1775]